MIVAWFSSNENPYRRCEKLPYRHREKKAATAGERIITYNEPKMNKRLSIIPPAEVIDQFIITKDGKELTTDLSIMRSFETSSSTNQQCTFAVVTVIPRTGRSKGNGYVHDLSPKTCIRPMRRQNKIILIERDNTIIEQQVPLKFSFFATKVFPINLITFPTVNKTKF